MSKERPAIKLTLRNGGDSNGKEQWLFVSDITKVRRDKGDSAHLYSPRRSIVFVNTEAKYYHVSENRREIGDIILDRLIDFSEDDQV